MRKHNAQLERGRMGKNKHCRKTVVFPFQRVAAGNGQEFYELGIKPSGGAGKGIAERGNSVMNSVLARTTLSGFAGGWSVNVL